MTERPTYDRTLLGLRERGADVRLVTLEVDGIAVDEVAQLLGTGARPAFAHVIPNFQNPAGYTLSLAKRERLLSLAREHGFLLFEDDPYVDIRFSGEPLPRMLELDGGPDSTSVVYACSFSKTVCPGIRVGYLVGPPELIDRIRVRATNTYIAPGMVAQATVYEYLRGPRFPAAIERIRTALGERVDLLCSALTEHLPQAVFARPDGGYFLWVSLPEGEGHDGRRIAAEAAARGVGIVPGADFLLEGGANSFRLAYSACSRSRSTTACAASPRPWRPRAADPVGPGALTGTPEDPGGPPGQAPGAGVPALPVPDAPVLDAPVPDVSAPDVPDVPVPALRRARRVRPGRAGARAGRAASGRFRPARAGGPAVRRAGGGAGGRPAPPVLVPVEPALEPVSEGVEPALGEPVSVAAPAGPAVDPLPPSARPRRTTRLRRRARPPWDRRPPWQRRPCPRAGPATGAPVEAPVPSPAPVAAVPASCAPSPRAVPCTPTPAVGPPAVGAAAVGPPAAAAPACAPGGATVAGPGRVAPPGSRARWEVDGDPAVLASSPARTVPGDPAAPDRPTTRRTVARAQSRTVPTDTGHHRRRGSAFLAAVGAPRAPAGIGTGTGTGPEVSTVVSSSGRGSALWRPPPGRPGRDRRAGGAPPVLEQPVEGVAQRGAVGQPAGRVLGRRGADQAADLLGHVRRERRRGLGHLLGGDLHRVGPVEGGPAGQALVAHQPEGVDVAGGGAPFPAACSGER